MKIKYLFQALRFACLPTLSILVLLFFGFFDIGKTIDFISSDQPFAIMLRVVLVIAEIVLIYIMHKEYEKKDIIENPDINNTNGTAVSDSAYVRHLNDQWDSRDKYKKHFTKDPNIVVIERKPYN